MEAPNEDPMESTSDVTMFIDVGKGSKSVLEILKVQPVDSEDEQTTMQDDDQTMSSVQDPPSDPEQSSKNEKKPRIRCPECLRYTTDSEERMVRHIRKNHQGQNPFQCSMCEYSTYNKSVFEEHVRIHKGIKPFKCAYCPYRSASKKNKNKHELIHRKNNPLKCDLCPFIAHHYRSLLCHKQKHENGEFEEENEAKSDEFECDVCLYRFPTVAALQRHKGKKTRNCNLCDTNWCSPYYFRKHMISEHGVKKDAFTCKICGWMGSVRMKVLLHLIHHPNQEFDEQLFSLNVLRKHGIVK